MYGKGDKTAAIKEIKTVLFKNMGNFTVWHILGIIMNKEKDYD